MVRDRCNFLLYPTHWSTGLKIRFCGHLTLSRNEEECPLVMMDSELEVLPVPVIIGGGNSHSSPGLRAGLISWGRREALDRPKHLPCGGMPQCPVGGYDVHLKSSLTFPCACQAEVPSKYYLRWGLVLNQSETHDQTVLVHKWESFCLMLAKNKIIHLSPRAR